MERSKSSTVKPTWSRLLNVWTPLQGKIACKNLFESLAPLDERTPVRLDEHRRGTRQCVEVRCRRVLVGAGVEERNQISVRNGGRFDVPSEQIEIARLTHDLDRLHGLRLGLRREDGPEIGVFHEQTRKKHLGGVEFNPGAGNGAVLSFH